MISKEYGRAKRTIWSLFGIQFGEEFGEVLLLRINSGRTSSSAPDPTASGNLVWDRTDTSGSTRCMIRHVAPPFAPTWAPGGGQASNRGVEPALVCCFDLCWIDTERNMAASAHKGSVVAEPVSSHRANWLLLLRRRKTYRLKRLAIRRSNGRPPSMDSGFDGR